MEKAVKELKRDLIRKSGAVKRTIKEYISYVKETEKEKEKLEKIKEEKKNDEGAIKRQSDCVFECNGAKIASFQTLKKSYEALKEFIETIETHDDDEDTRKSREEIKGLEEFNEAKKHLENAKEVLDKDEASNAAPEQYAPPNK